MAIKGLEDLLKKYKNGELNESQFEESLGKELATEYIPKAKFNEVNEAKKLAEANLTNANKTLEELKGKSDLSDEYKKQIEKLTADNAKAQEDFKAQMNRLRLDTAIENGLREAKARNTKATRALLDESKFTVSEDGTVGGLKEQIEAIAKENAFLFEAPDPSAGGKPSWGSPNGSPQGGSGADSLQAAMRAAAGLN